MKRVRVKIFGRVQGVGFRDSIYTKALLYGIRGWVRNLDNGQVEAVFEGEEENIKKMLEFCKKGSLLSNIESTEIKEEKHKGEDKFRILR
ncbi:MAG: acylphosphatase [Nanoarchaeota archaeon]